jgi:hypothetical protein
LRRVSNLAEAARISGWSLASLRDDRASLVAVHLLGDGPALRVRSTYQLAPFKLAVLYQGAEAKATPVGESTGATTVAGRAVSTSRGRWTDGGGHTSKGGSVWWNDARHFLLTSDSVDLDQLLPLVADIS